MRTGRSPVLFLGSAVLAFPLIAGAPTQNQAAHLRDLMIDPYDSTLVALGKNIYQAHCASCHGTNLEGEPNWRTRKSNGRLPAPPHDASGHTWHHPDKMLFMMTKYGPSAVARRAYQSGMPPFVGTLTDREIVAALAYIKSTWPPHIRQRNAYINRMYHERMR